MAWNDEAPEFREIAERVCTPNELEVLRLKAHGCGRRRGAAILGISEEAWRYRMRNALQKVKRAREAAQQ